MSADRKNVIRLGHGVTVAINYTDVIVDHAEALKEARAAVGLLREAADTYAAQLSALEAKEPLARLDLGGATRIAADAIALAVVANHRLRNPQATEEALREAVRVEPREEEDAKP